MLTGGRRAAAARGPARLPPRFAHLLRACGMRRGRGARASGGRRLMQRADRARHGKQRHPGRAPAPRSRPARHVGAAARRSARRGGRRGPRAPLAPLPRVSRLPAPVAAL
jgi:hypothetical protein